MANLRIGGLASGMDIDQIVGDLMKAERMPLNKLKQQKQILQWQRDDYRSMNSLLLNFRTELTNMKLTTQYRARSVTSTNTNLISATASSAASKASYTISSVSSLASAATKVSSSLSSNSADKLDPTQSIYSQQAKLGSFEWSKGSVGSQTFKGDGMTSEFSITKNHSDEKLKMSELQNIELQNMSVKVNGKAYTLIQDGDGVTPSADQVAIDEDGKLRFGAPIAKDATIKFDYILNNKIEVKSLEAGTSDFQIASTPLSTLKVEINGTTYTAGTAMDGKSSLMDDNGDSIGNVNLETGKVEFVPALDTAAEVKFTYTQPYSSFNLTTQTSKGEVKENIIITSADSLNQVINKVNSSSAGVTMFYDRVSDKLSLTRTETGDFLRDGTLSEKDGEKVDQISANGLFATDILKLTTTPSYGANAEFNINGLDTRRATNTFEMNGVTFTLKNTFSDTPVSMSINNDSNKVFENIKAFVDKYNELIDKIQKKSSEEYYRSYKPLTDEQRETLSEKQQEQWEEKAKSGLLKRDPILTGVLSGMRSNFYAPVRNAAVDPLMNQLASIGIKTTANYLEGGKLEINEAALKKAIEDNPESVENLFRGAGTSSDEQGIVHRLYDTVNGAMDKLKARAGNSFSTTKQFTLGRQLDNVDSQINRFESRLTQIEDRYWRQFTAMEKAIQKANSQSMYLMQQFSL